LIPLLIGEAVRKKFKIKLLCSTLEFCLRTADLIILF
jgi:hypothetical protein